jgi:hypothetical protein
MVPAVRAAVAAALPAIAAPVEVEEVEEIAAVPIVPAAAVRAAVAAALPAIAAPVEVVEVPAVAAAPIVPAAAVVAVRTALPATTEVAVEVVVEAETAPPSTAVVVTVRAAVPATTVAPPATKALFLSSSSSTSSAKYGFLAPRIVLAAPLVVVFARAQMLGDCEENGVPVHPKLPIRFDPTSSNLRIDGMEFVERIPSGVFMFRRDKSLPTGWDNLCMPGRLSVSTAFVRLSVHQSESQEESMSKNWKNIKKDVQQRKIIGQSCATNVPLLRVPQQENEKIGRNLCVRSARARRANSSHNSTHSFTHSLTHSLNRRSKFGVSPTILRGASG